MTHSSRFRMSLQRFLSSSSETSSTFQFSSRMCTLGSSWISLEEHETLASLFAPWACFFIYPSSLLQFGVFFCFCIILFVLFFTLWRMVLKKPRTSLFVPVKVQEQGEHMKTPEVFISLNDLELLCTEFDYFDLCFNMFFSVIDRGRLFC